MLSKSPQTRHKLICFEDEHLLAVNKPAGLNTHLSSPFGGEGLYDWLRHREPRWASLALIHRLDKETSGVMVFAKTALANRSLTEQFAQHTVRKKYVLLTDRPSPRELFTATSSLVRVGEKYLSRPMHAGGEHAETHFRVIRTETDRCLVEAEPATGRTHQIRVHAAEHGFPILGDTLYGGANWPRLCLHSEALTLNHPASGLAMTFEVKADFSADARTELRALMIDSSQTNAFRLIHGESDGWPGWYVDKLGDFLLSHAETEMNEEQCRHLDKLPEFAGVYHKLLRRQPGLAISAEVSPQFVSGRSAAGPFLIRENGVCFEISFNEGSSVGLFLDQRDNRRRFLVNHISADFPVFSGGPAGKEVLNAFAYTCGFSVCAAMGGARTTSIDLSKKYLEWGRRNFRHNQLDPARHDFIYGDVFNWLPRFARKQRMYDVVALDPPTFSRSKERGSFQAQMDFGALVRASLPVLKSGGVLFASTNAAGWKAEEFAATVQAAVGAGRRRVLQQHYFPQPPDFPISRAEPGYLKTIWMQIQ